MSASEIDGDVQATMYLLARREEARAGWGAPATGFDFHVMKNLRTPTAEWVSAPRTDSQLDALYQRVLDVARSIAWRAETDIWEAPSLEAGGAPEILRFFGDCPMGGAR